MPARIAFSPDNSTNCDLIKENNMWRNKSVSALVLVIFALAVSADAQDQQCYTVASVQGTWALIATYGANVAISFGERSVDGSGNFTGVFVVNGPTAGSTTGDRTITT
jgi:hypothetical protein